MTGLVSSMGMHFSINSAKFSSSIKRPLVVGSTLSQHTHTTKLGEQLVEVGGFAGGLLLRCFSLVVEGVDGSLYVPLGLREEADSLRVGGRCHRLEVHHHIILRLIQPLQWVAFLN